MKKTLAAAAALLTVAGLVGALAVSTVMPAGATPPRASSSACTASVPVSAPGQLAALTGADLAARAARDAGWPAQELVKAVAVAGAESTFDPSARNSIGASGLWQIFEPAHPQFAAQWADGTWRDPQVNARMALTVWRASGWDAWTTVTGADTPGRVPTYPRFLADAQRAVDALDSAPARPRQPEPCAPKPAAPTGTSTEAIPCAVGGAGEVWQAPGSVPIRVCAAGPFVVDTTLAPQIAALLRDSAAAGLTIGGSGARSNQRQKELYAQNCRGGRCRPPTAVPGTSQHEWALAVDLTCQGGSAFSFGRSLCYPWMLSNAARYGLKQLPSEAWHFSTTGA